MTYEDILEDAGGETGTRSEADPTREEGAPAEGPRTAGGPRAEGRALPGLLTARNAVQVLREGARMRTWLKVLVPGCVIWGTVNLVLFFLEAGTMLNLVAAISAAGAVVFGMLALR